jgi:hypothetical protein
MTKHMTGDSEVERDLRKMKPPPQALTVRTVPGGKFFFAPGVVGKIDPHQ